MKDEKTVLLDYVKLGADAISTALLKDKAMIDAQRRRMETHLKMHERLIRYLEAV